MAAGNRVSEPLFAEPLPSRNPVGFATPHASDDQVYSEVEALLQSQTTTFDKSRLADDHMITLAELYGSRGADVCNAIESTNRIVFHAMGDTGSSDSRKYQTELTVSDQLTLDAITSEPTNRPAFAFHLGDVVYSFGEARSITISSTTRSATTRRQFWRSRAIMTHLSCPALLRQTNRCGPSQETSARPVRSSPRKRPPFIARL
jgi:hypothetical protein